MLQGSSFFQSKIRNELLDFIPVLNSWIFKDLNNKMIDPYETIYSENYAPANAAVIYASVYKFNNDPNLLAKCHDMISRSVVLLNNKKTVSSFCRVFLIHYSLMAISLLPKKEKERFLLDFKEFYATYEDDCKQINTNCVALQYGTELLIRELGIRSVNTSYMEHLIKLILKSQNKKGFINDSVNFNGISEDGMPIVYHSFILFILISVISAIDNVNGIPVKQKNMITEIIKQGLSWFSNTVSSDGSFAMAERSSYQVFTFGVMTTLCCYAGIKDEEFLIKILKYWSKFKKEDGSYSCTPNHLPHELRTGYEAYTHVNMYNNLAMTGLVIADIIISKNLHLRDQQLVDMFFENTNFIDFDSGYAFIRKDKNFGGFALRMHQGRYMPAMTGFHYRFSEHPVPIAESKLDINSEIENRLFLDGIWEGFLFKDSEGSLVIPDSTQNAETVMLENGIQFHYEDKNLICVKSTIILGDEIEWKYKITPKRNFVSCTHIVPLIYFDGINGLRVLEKSANTINLYYSGNQYQLSCNSARQVDVLLERSLLSISGVSTKASIPIKTIPQENQTFEWRTSLRLCGSVSSGKPLHDKLSAEDVLPVLKKVTMSKSSPQPCGTQIRFNAEASGNDLNYAWYVYKGETRILTKWYSSNNYFDWSPNESGNYKICIFIKDKLGYMISEFLDEYVIESMNERQ